MLDYEQLDTIGFYLNTIYNEYCLLFGCFQACVHYQYLLKGKTNLDVGSHSIDNLN